MSSIIDSQRQILRDTGLIDRPQVQTLYKEVQRYWDKGYRPPDDVTVVFCDDNWGNMRKLPDPSLPARSGGYGMYYHFDYVGGGRNYKWADTANLANTWEQLHLAYASGVDRLWVANVGDLKNEELPTQFFLDYAWNPSAWPVQRLGEWTRQYAAENFGPQLAPADRGHPRRVRAVCSRAASRNCSTGGSRWIPPRTSPPTRARWSTTTRPRRSASPTTGRWTASPTQWLALAARADRLKARVPAAWQDAFYQLVYYQVKDTAIVYDLRRAEFTNIAYAAQGRAATNALADRAEALFAEDQAMSDYYNTTLAGGKWHNWQLQPKIGYGNVARYGPNAPWQQPELNNVALPDEIFPYLKRITVPDGPAMGVALDGGDPAVLPAFSPWQSQPAQYIDVYNKGATPFRYRITSAQPWVRVSPASGEVGDQVRAVVTVDWRRAPKGATTVPLTVTGAGSSTVVQAPIDNPALRPKGFLEANGYVAIEADHYSHKAGDWRLLPGIGKTGNGMTPLGGAGARLDYTMTLTTSGPVDVTAYLSPRNNVLPTDGLKYAVSIDGGAAADGERDRGDRRQRHHDEPAVGAQHLGQHQPHHDHAHDRPARHAHADLLDGRPHRDRAAAGRGHRWREVQLPGPTREPEGMTCGDAQYSAWRARRFRPPPSPGPATAGRRRWIHTWTAMPQLTEPGNLPPAPFTGDGVVLADTTLRQTAHVTIGGPRVRVRFSNAFGGAALPITAAAVAKPAGGKAGVSAIVAGSGRPLTFGGHASVVVPVGAQIVSDPVPLPAATGENITVTVYLATGQASLNLTSHPGSRTTSYLVNGDHHADLELPGAVGRSALVSAQRDRGGVGRAGPGRGGRLADRRAGLDHRRERPLAGPAVRPAAAGRGAQPGGRRQPGAQRRARAERAGPARPGRAVHQRRRPSAPVRGGERHRHGGGHRDGAEPGGGRSAAGVLADRRAGARTGHHRLRSHDHPVRRQHRL